MYKKLSTHSDIDKNMLGADKEEWDVELLAKAPGEPGAWSWQNKVANMAGKYIFQMSLLKTRYSK